jgi:macrolide-specific efflux system membrane fusion protein
VLYNVLFDVTNPDGALLPQMSAQAYFVLARADNALLVPVSALAAARESQAPMDAEPRPAGGKAKSKASQQKFVVRVLTNGQVEKREVSVGVMTRSTAQVVSGLKEGESVLLSAAGTGEEKKDKKKGFDLFGLLKQ